MPTVLVGEDIQSVVLEGPLLLAGLLAMAAGAVSFFSPCCLPLVPGYLSYVAGLAGQDAEAVVTRTSTAPAVGGVAVSTPTRPAGVPPRVRRRAVWGAVLFVAGFAAVFTGYGAAFGSLGGLLITYQDTLVRILGVVTILLGLVFSGLLWRLPFLNRTLRVQRQPRSGLVGAPVVGVLFGLGWTPCIGPTLAAVLFLATSTGDADRGAALAFAYSIGLGIPFILVAAGLQRFLRTVTWARRHARTITITGGAMLILLGLLMVTGVWTALIAQMQGWITGFEPPL